MPDDTGPAPRSLFEKMGLSPFGLKAAIGLYALFTLLWVTGIGWWIGTDLTAMRPMTHEEITAARWHKTTDPAQLGKSQSSPVQSPAQGINDLFRPNPSGINPFDATRQAQTPATPLTADWPQRIEAAALLAGPPIFGLLGVAGFAWHLRRQEKEQADALAAEKIRQDEERHRARRRGKGIPMRRLR